MKKIITILCVSFSISFFYAQEIPNSIIKSEVFKDEYKHSFISLVEDDGNNGVFIVRSYQGGVFSSGAGYYFEHYDSNLKLIKEYEYEMKRSEFEKYGSILGVIMNGDQVSLIDFVYNSQEKAFVCSALTSSINEFKFAKKELFKLAYEDVMKSQWFGGNQFDGDSGTNFILNEDKTAFAITIDIKDKNTETHKVFLFDNKLNKKIDHDFKRDVKDKKFKYENIDVSKDGNNLYLLGKVFTDEKKKKKEGGKYQYELTRISKEGQVTQVFDTEEHFSGSLKTIVFEDKLTCIGFYSDRKDYRYKGISYFELDPITLAIRKSKYNPFTEQFVIDKYGKSKDKELKNLSFRGILITQQNEIVFNAEEYYVTSNYQRYPNGGGYMTYTYHYDDIVSAKMANDGSIIWARNINKRQATSGDDSYISYTSTIKGNDTYFFINTGEKVKKLSNNRIQFGQTSTKKSNLNVIRISPDGNFDFQEILDDKESEVPFMVSDGAISRNSVYFIGRKGKKKQILKVSL